MTGNIDTVRHTKGHAVFLSLLMVLSVVAMSAAFAGSAVADEHPLEASLSNETYDSVGDEITVELDLSPTGEEPVPYDGAGFQFEYDSDSLEFVDGEGDGIDVSGPSAGDGTIDMIVFESGEITDDTNVAITFEVTQEFDQADLTFTGDPANYVAYDEEEYEIGWSDGSITDGESADDWWNDYTNESGVVETPGLQDAIGDWSSGELDTGQLQDLIQSWSTGTPVNS